MVFGEVADDYDEVRPGYQAELARAVVEYADGPARLVEVGAGTGKATAALAVRVRVRLETVLVMGRRPRQPESVGAGC
jgi:ubiquinone/menaquinone biosynthesis C-methylase UbiE